MPKTITINNISVKEIGISEDKGKYTISIIYTMVDTGGDEFSLKRSQITDDKLTPAQKAGIRNVLTIIADQVKQAEKIS